MPVDLRTRKLAKQTVNYSVFTKPGETVVISAGTEAMPFIQELYKAVILAGAHPVLRLSIPDIADFFYKYANKEQIEKFPEILEYIAKKADKWIGVDTTTNTQQLNNSNSKKIVQREKVVSPLSDYICNNQDKINRCAVAYPVSSLAQDAKMSLTEYENFVYGACLQNWKKLFKQIHKLRKTFEQASNVYLIGKNVDLKFSIKEKNCVADCGEENMPGGEIFMAPIRESLNGWIKFEYPLTNAPKHIEDVYLKFENGKIIEFDASKNKELLQELINIDENASYVGEFGIGCNPKIRQFTSNLLFDEKISGTIHLALGRAYKENGGGNDSAIHIDIVKDMSQAKIVLDGKVVQENGKWKISGIKL
jgi:aminopeptidase